MKTKFKPGERVQVREGTVPPWCSRTPAYIRGKRGIVEIVHGAFENAESLSCAGYGKEVLYQVRFNQADVWTDYKGPPQDKLLGDIYEHWLEPA